MHRQAAFAAIAHLHKDIQPSLVAVLAPDEEIVGAVNGSGRTGLVATTDRILVHTRDAWVAWRYTEVSNVSLKSQAPTAVITVTGRQQSSRAAFVTYDKAATGRASVLLPVIGLRIKAGSQVPVIVRQYQTGVAAGDALGQRQYLMEANLLANLGYEVISTAASDKASAFGLKVGALTVTYRLRPPAEREPTPTEVAPTETKACPDCAETVLAAARICRYCRHEFASAVEATQGE